jgi:hypothetical protein
VRDRLAGRCDTEVLLAIESPPPRRKKVRLEVA